MSKNFVSYPDALEVLNAYADEINKSVKKYSVMPTYTNFPLGSIIQYVGDDTGDYVNGYFYERTASGWVQKNIQPPTSGLGTAAFLDVAESGDAASTEVVMGNDSRLTNARPASDVPAWAKAANKPAYTKAEVGLANVDNTSDSTKKTNFTGSIASGNTGFTTGGDVYTALDGKVDKVTGKGLSTNDYTDEDKGIVDGITDALADIFEEVSAISDVSSQVSYKNDAIASTDQIPYLQRQALSIDGASPYVKEKLVGASAVVNQLVDSGMSTVTIASGHKYALYHNSDWTLGQSAGTAISVVGGTDMLIDLTALFGSSTIPDYLYSLEQATAGSGVAKLKEWGFLTKDYYPYNAGSLQSVNCSGKKVSGMGFELIYSTLPIDLRGLYKLDANNNLYADGDEYNADGSVSRKYGIVDLGSLSWAGSNGVYNAYLPDYVNDPVVRNLCKEAFAEFFDNQIGYYDKTTYTTVSLMGSVALHFKEIIEEVAKEKNITLGTIIGAPMPKLIAYHTQYV